MTSIDHLTLEVDNPAAAQRFYESGFGLGREVRLRASKEPTAGFRGFTLSLIVSQPAAVDELLSAAADAGATTLKAAKKQFWGGYSGVVQAPDGTIWKVATQSKKNTGPATRGIDALALLLGVDDVPASKRYYVEHGLTVTRSIARSYVEFAAEPDQIKLGLYKRRALAKDAGVSPDGSGSHRLVIHGDAGAFADPDGFEWNGTAEDPAYSLGTCGSSCETLC